ncbi:MAG: TonB-dependent receptor, partial [Lautropia sp.]
PAAPAAAAGVSTMLPEVRVSGESAWGELPATYAGGQVARGGRLGMLGNRDFMDAPFNVTNLTEQTIADQQASSVAEVVSANDPSVTGGGGGTIGDGYTIRGMGYESAEVMVNGVPGLAPIWRINPNFLERVEVLKGPNALLNGATIWGSVGGSISVVPKRAGDDPLLRLTTSYASDSRISAHVDTGRRFGEGGAFGLRVNGTLGRGDYALDRLSERQNQLAVALDWRSDRIRVSADLLHQKQHMKGGKWGTPSLAAAITRVPPVPDNEVSWSQPWESAKVTEDVAVVRGEFDLTKDITLHLAGGTSKSDQDYITSMASIVNDAGAMTQAFRTHQTPYESRTMDAGLSGKLRTGGVGHEWVLNLTRMYNENGNGRGTVTPASTATNLYDPVLLPAPTSVVWPVNGAPKGGDRINSSLAIADTMSFDAGRTLLTLGARRQIIENNSFNPAGAVTASYRKGAWTPMVGAVHRLRPSVALYANYIEGLSPGQVAPVAAVNAGEVFEPFKTRQGELGVKFDLGRLAVTTSLFQIERANGMLDPVTSVFSNDGRQRNRGLEVNVFGQPVRGVRLLAGIALIDAELTRTAGGVNEGNTAAGQPKFRVNLGAEFDIAAVRGLSANARVIHRGAQYLNSANTFELPAWTRVDVGARYLTELAGRPVALRFGIENVFDRDYWQQGLTVGAPRTYLLSVAVDF